MIALLKKGDEIFIDGDNHGLSLNLSDEEIVKRKENFLLKTKDLQSRWLWPYRSLVINAANGAILKVY